LGIIPRDWEVEKFKDITSILTCGVASTPKYVRPDIGVPFLSAQNVQSNGIVLEKFSYISKEFHQELTKNNKPSFGDILYSRVGAGYGQSAVVEFQWEFSVYVSLTLIRLIKGFNNYFYSHLLNSKPYKDKASINVFQGGGVPNLNVNEVRVFDMICPKITEQNMIAERLNSVDQKLHTEQTYLHKLQQLKAGLMGDLLSGRKKVMGLYSESIEKE
jgi:type I restriction enzyme S subunit